jgi:hypothetical protein
VNGLRQVVQLLLWGGLAIMLGMIVIGLIRAIVDWWVLYQWRRHHRGPSVTLMRDHDPTEPPDPPGGMAA